MTDRSHVLELFRSASPGRLALWASSKRGPTDCVERESRLDVFDVPEDEQRPLFDRLRALREKARRILGEPVLLIFHTPEATAQHYEYVREASDDVSTLSELRASR